MSTQVRITGTEHQSGADGRPYWSIEITRFRGGQQPYGLVVPDVNDMPLDVREALQAWLAGAAK